MERLQDNPTVAALFSGRADHIEPAPGDFMGADGRLHCGVCRQPKEFRIPFNGHWVPSLCDCGKAARAEVYAREAESREQAPLNELRPYSLLTGRLRDATFERAQIREEHRAAFEKARAWTDGWETYSRGRMNGLMIYGPNGTGKTYLAACIANRLLERRVPVLMTSPVRLLVGWEDELARVFQLTRSARLLILDDFGAERGTDFKVEQLYSLLDDRCRLGLATVITTNYDIEWFQNGEDLRYNRIYERVKSMCYPILMNGASWRARQAERSLAELDRRLGGQDDGAHPA